MNPSLGMDGGAAPTVQPAPAATPATLAKLAAYGLFAMPLAFAALPLYVQWPAHAAGTWGMSLGVLGALLLAVRIFDAFVDPWIGSRIDALFARSTRNAWAAAGAAALAVACGMAALMFAPAAVRAEPAALVAWAAAALVLTSLGYSVAMVTHQAWAVRLGGSSAEQARWVGAREGLALAGVIVASVLPSQVGWAATVAVLAALLGLSWLMLSTARPGERAGAPPRPATAAAASAAHPTAAHPTAAHPTAARPAAAHPAPSRSPWHERGFRRLMVVVLVSGLASAIPASLVLMFVRDVLQASAAAEGGLLALYFAAAALGMPLWVRAVRRRGLVWPWFAGMWVSIAAFAGAALLGPGDVALFALVCIASGLALGADLVVPPALLAGLIQRRSGQPPAQAESAGAGTGARPEHGIAGLWFGWWNFGMKLTLAAAAGLALPLVQALGYSPGERSSASLSALALCYAALPCIVKAIAALTLFALRGTWPWALQAAAATGQAPLERALPTEKT